MAWFQVSREARNQAAKAGPSSNDADLQGFGAIAGRGVELVITLGTGFGSSLFVDGKLVPNLEVAHYPVNGKTYEQMLGNAARKEVGNKKWNEWLTRAIEALYLVFNYDHLYIGRWQQQKSPGWSSTRYSRYRQQSRSIGGESRYGKNRADFMVVSSWRIVWVECGRFDISAGAGWFSGLTR
jgi:hypothetical protein